MSLGSQDPIIPTWLKMLYIAAPIMIMFSLASALGFFAVFGTAMDVADGDVAEPALEDYEPVQELRVENGTVVAVLEEKPRFESAGSVGEQKVTHLQLTRERGGVGGTQNVTIGQTTYRFELPDDPAGNYTLALKHQEPADPGLFGHGPRTSNQVIKFQIGPEGELTVTEVPYEARYD